MFCWETLGPGVHADATWHTPPYQYTLLMGMATPPMPVAPLAEHCILTHYKNCSGTDSQQHKKQNNESKELIGLPMSPDPNPTEHLWGCTRTSLIHGRPTPPQRAGPKGSTTTVPVPDTTGQPQRSTWTCFDKSELFWLHKEKRARYHICGLNVVAFWCICSVVGFYLCISGFISFFTGCAISSKHNADGESHCACMHAFLDTDSTFSVSHKWSTSSAYRAQQAGENGNAIITICPCGDTVYLAIMNLPENLM